MVVVGGAKFFFLGGNFGGDKLGFVAKFWWKVVVGFLEGKRGKIDEKEERETFFFFFFLRIFFFILFDRGVYIIFILF